MAMPSNPDTIPIFTATKSLDLRYAFEEQDSKIILKGADIHAKLSAGCSGFLAARDSIVYSNGKKKYTASIDTINIATAAITFLYSDTPQAEGYLGEDVFEASFALSVYKDTRILSCKDLYSHPINQAKVAANKALRDTFFNKYLFNRINTFNAIVMQYDIPFGTITSKAGLKESIESGVFHETFHHSEQAMLHRLSSANGIRSLVATAQSIEAKFIYAINLDIFTQRMICKNCNAGIIGMQNSQTTGFLSDLTASLNKSDIETNKLIMSSRISAKKAGNGNTLGALRQLKDDKKHRHQHSAETNVVYQAENKALGTKKIIKAKGYGLETYSGSFFVSQKFSSASLEKKLKQTKRVRLKPI
jgi:hypothetical protein